MIERIRLVAGADGDHGAWWRQQGRKAFPDPELREPGGIAAGPHPAGGRISRGEPLQLQTAGGVMADLGEGPVWVELAGGAIVNTGGRR